MDYIDQDVNGLKQMDFLQPYESLTNTPINIGSNSMIYTHW
jgi:hypothetical protein